MSVQPAAFCLAIASPSKKHLRMKNQLYLLLFSLAALGLVPAASAQIPGCGGPPSDVPPAESCLEACAYCGFTGLQGSTLGYAASPPPPGFCSTVQNDQWIGFVAWAASATFTLTPSNCLNGNGLEFALYENCSSPPLACALGQAGGGNIPLILTANDLVAGRPYYLLVDGYAGDTCEYSITVSPPPTDPPPVGTISLIQGIASVCPGASVSYEVSQVTGAGLYTWSSTTPGVRFDGQPSPADLVAPGGRKVQVAFPSNISGNVQLCVSASNPCYLGPTVCRVVSVKPIPPTVLPKIVLCNEDPPVAPYTNILTSWLGCDSVVQQPVTIKPPLTTNIGNKYICKGDSIRVCGRAIKDQGQIQEMCTSFQGCDSLVTGFLFVLDPQFQVTSSPKITLTCAQPEVTLSVGSTFGNTVIVWRKKSGPIIGTGKTITITQAGTYTATGSTTLGGVTCNYQKEFVVKENFTEPAPIKVVKSGSLTGGGSVQLLAHSLTPDLLYQWIGPQGFISVLQNPTVTVPGEYKVTAMHSLSGCTVMATVSVGF